jgi:putative ABC transport system permease protein
MLLELAITALRSIRGHKLRFALTSAGILWGVCMLCFLSATMDGYDEKFFGEVEKIGRKIVFVFAGGVTKDRIGARGGRDVHFEVEDADALGSLNSIESAGTNQWLGSRIYRVGRRTKLFWTMGATTETLAIRGYEVAQGRLFLRSEVDDAERVAFLGAVAAERLFGSAPAVGRTLHIESLPFRVIGVSRAKGEQLVHMDGTDDELVYIPITAAQRWFVDEDAIRVLVYAPVTREASWGTLDPVRETLARRHDFDPDSETAVSFFNIEEALDVVRLLGVGLRVFLTAASIVTLLVGAVGVMNIMLVVVGERRKEIGLRKAVGATEREIFLQFLAETLIVTVFSGLLGLGLGVLLVRGAAALSPGEGAFATYPIVEPATLGVVAAVLVVVGLLAGVLPALRAARVDPAVSLRAL